MRFTHGRDRRIRRRADFLHVQSKGERALTPHFVLLVARPQTGRRARSSASAEPQAIEPQPKGPARLGVVATKKVGNAAVRNRIKRLCRECFRLWPGFVPDGIDLVVIARDGAHELRLEAVRLEWARARPTLLKRCASVLATRSG